MIAENKNSGESGMTLIEMIIVVAIFSMMLAGIYRTLEYAMRFYTTGKTKSELQVEGIKAMELMTNELRQGGLLLIDDTLTDPYFNGNLYPYVFADGDADAGGAFPYFSIHNHPFAQHRADPWEASYGATTEIVFKTIRNADGLLADFDGDGYATDAVTGGIEWSNDEISYVLVTDNNGRNVLERRVNGQFSRVIARDVEGVTFDTMYTNNQVKLYQVVIALYFDRTTIYGQRIRTSIASTVNLRNAGEVF